MQLEPVAAPDHSGRVLFHNPSGGEGRTAKAASALDLQVPIVRRGGVLRVQGLLLVAPSGADLRPEAAHPAAALQEEAT